MMSASNCCFSPDIGWSHICSKWNFSSTWPHCVQWIKEDCRFFVTLFFLPYNLSWPRGYLTSRMWQGDVGPVAGLVCKKTSYFCFLESLHLRQSFSESSHHAVRRPKPHGEPLVGFPVDSLTEFIFWAV